MYCNLLWYRTEKLLNGLLFSLFLKIINFIFSDNSIFWQYTYIVYLSLFCATFLWSVLIDKARVDVLDHIRHLLGQFIIWHALTNAEGYVLWCNRASSVSVFANKNNDVTLFREVNCKMRLFAMKYSIEFEEKIN